MTQMLNIAQYSQKSGMCGTPKSTNKIYIFIYLLLNHIIRETLKNDAQVNKEDGTLKGRTNRVMEKVSVEERRYELEKGTIT